MYVTLFSYIYLKCCLAIFIQISNPYSTAISTVCDGGTNTGACAVAIGSISDDCSDSLVDGDTSVCSGSGTCATQLNAAVSACGSSVSLIA